MAHVEFMIKIFFSLHICDFFFDEHTIACVGEKLLMNSSVIYK